MVRATSFKSDSLNRMAAIAALYLMMLFVCLGSIPLEAIGQEPGSESAREEAPGATADTTLGADKEAQSTAEKPEQTITAESKSTGNTEKSTAAFEMPNSVYHRSRFDPKRVAPGPMQAQRKQLLGQLLEAERRGVGTRAYILAFHKLEDRVKNGATESDIKEELFSIVRQLHRQVHKSNRIKFTRRKYKLNDGQWGLLDKNYKNDRVHHKGPRAHYHERKHRRP